MMKGGLLKYICNISHYSVSLFYWLLMQISQFRVAKNNVQLIYKWRSGLEFLGAL